MSSYEWSQYMALDVPLAYSRAKTESVCSARLFRGAGWDQGG